MSPQQTVTPEDARAISKDAYIYAIAPIESFRTWRKQAVDAAGHEYIGGFNVFRHYAQAFTPENKDIVTPNNDTPYSWAWLDLRAEPMVLSVPDVPDSRYYVMQLIDIFTYNFAYVGTRKTGDKAGYYLISGPGWSGDKPKGITEVLHAESDIVGILGRTQLNGPDDVENVKAVQAGYKLDPLSEFVGQSAPALAPPIDFPPFIEDKATGREFLGYLNFLLQFAQPSVAQEKELMARFAKIGVEPGNPWDAGQFGPELLTAIDEGVVDAKAEMKRVIDSTLSSNGLFGSRKQMGSDYSKRAAGALKGLYGNSIEEAWYGGFVGDGSKPSQLTFPTGQLPPAKFFWSLTLYTLPDRLLYANAIDRYSIGDRTKGLAYDPDRSLTITLSHESPGQGKEANWLPTPDGHYSLVGRIYGPSQDAMDGKWQLPKLEPLP